jgi:hypothetical protein
MSSPTASTAPGSGEQADSSSPVLLLDHVNLNVRTWSDELARFWWDALGCVSDPRTPSILATNLAGGCSMQGLQWANIGLQQVHMCIGEPEEADQSMANGIVGMSFPNLAELKNRLDNVGVAWDEDAESAGGVTSVSAVGAWHASQSIRLASPTGVRIRAHEAASGAQWFGPLGAKDAGCCQPGGPSNGLGIGYVEFAVPTGSAAGIGRFYAQTLGIPAPVAGGCCRVAMRTGQCLLFRETAADVPAYDGHHICFCMPCLDLLTAPAQQSHRPLIPTVLQM